MQLSDRSLPLSITPIQIKQSWKGQSSSSSLLNCQSSTFLVPVPMFVQSPKFCIYVSLLVVLMVGNWVDVLGWGGATFSWSSAGELDINCISIWFSGAWFLDKCNLRLTECLLHILLYIDNRCGQSFLIRLSVSLPFSTLTWTSERWSGN